MYRPLGGDLPPTIPATNPEPASWQARLSDAESHAPITVAADFLDQVIEPGPKGKKSCLLTSMINASIVSGSLKPSEAIEAQDRFCTDRKFDPFWRFGGLGKAWKMSPYATDVCLDIWYGSKSHPVIVAHELATDTREEISLALGAGRAAILIGKSTASPHHARMAFQPQGLPGSLFVHDPNPAHGTTGLYDTVTALRQFQLNTQAVVY